MKLKRYLLLPIIFLTALSFAQTGVTKIDSIKSAGLTAGTNVYRNYRLYVPKSYDGTKPYPLVFSFHGTGSNAQEQEQMTRFNVIADTANFLVVYPNGLVQSRSGNKTAWNSLGSVQDNKDTDLKFIDNLLDTISAEYKINSCRVYACGMSIGGYMTYDVGFFLNERFAAIASVTGIMLSTHYSAGKTSVKRPTPVMHIHGDADNVVSYNGGTGQASVDTLVNWWVNYNNCTKPATKTSLPNSCSSDGSTAENYTYPNGKNKSAVELYKILGGGHNWPTNIFCGSTSGNNNDFNASLAIWKFFRPHCLDDLKGSDSAPCTPPTAVITGGDTLCPGGKTYPQVALTGKAPWSLVRAVDGVSQTAVSVPTTPYTFTANSSGTITIVSVTDANGCNGTGSGQAIVKIFSPISVSNKTETCNGSDYVVEFDVSGGDTSSYKVTGGTGSFISPTHFKTNAISSGASYSLSVTDAFACANIVVSGSKTCGGTGCPVTATMSGDDTLCPSSSGNLKIEFTGTAPWTFTYMRNGADPKTLTVNTASYTFKITQTGLYKVTSVTDKSGCQGIADAGINVVNTEMFIESYPVKKVCTGNTYIVSFRVTGGDSTTYWVKGNSGTFNNYNDFVSDPISVDSVYSFEINDKYLCAGTPVEFGNSPCPGGGGGCTASATISGSKTICQGDAAVIAVALTGTEPYTFVYAIDGTNQPPITTSLATYTLSASSTGVYSLVSVTDKTSCVGTINGSATVTVTSPISTSSVKETCNSGMYVVEFDITGGEAPYSVTGGNINPGNRFVSNPIASGASYNFVVTDKNSCSSNPVSGAYTCTTTSGGGGCSATASISGSSTICSGATATVTVTLTGKEPWTIIYSKDGTNQSPVTATNSPYAITGLSPGNYELVSVVDGNNCTASVSGKAVVTQFSAISISGKTATCNGSNYVVAFYITGGDQASYKVNGGTGTMSSDAHFTSSPLSSGSTYSFTVTDKNACPSPASVSGTKTCNVGPCSASGTISGGGIVCKGSSTPLKIDLTGTPPWSFTINPGGYNITNQMGTPYSIDAYGSGNYTISDLSDANCSGTTSGSALVQNCLDTITPKPTNIVGVDAAIGIRVYPNPNDGNFYVVTEEISVSVMIIEVFNTLGLKVFEIIERDLSSGKSQYISLKELNAGLYYLRLSYGNNVLTEKMVIH